MTACTNVPRQPPHARFPEQSVRPLRYVVVLDTCRGGSTSPTPRTSISTRRVPGDSGGHRAHGVAPGADSVSSSVLVAIRSSTLSNVLRSNRLLIRELLLTFCTHCSMKTESPPNHVSISRASVPLVRRSVSHRKERASSSARSRLVRPEEERRRPQPESGRGGDRSPSLTALAVSVAAFSIRTHGTEA